MRKFLYITLNILFVLAFSFYIYSCASSGGSIDIKNDPIKPIPDIKEGTINPTNNAITISREGIIVTVEHWSRARLDRKYTTADTRSPFFYLETWPQSLQSEVFHVTIQNETPKSLTLNVKETTFNDDRKYIYQAITLDDIRYKFLQKSYMDLKTKNGLELATQILLLEKLGPNAIIPAGKTIDGFLAFFPPSSQAEKVWLIVTLEREPETPTAIPKKEVFRFDFAQDLVLRKTQPPTKR
ncbi:MAG: hypothetical protein ACUVWN_08435 [bacterium]